MLLAASRDMPENERKICTKEMIRGFRDCCMEAGTSVTGGQTVLNPWPIIGGVATSIVASRKDFVSSDGAQPGDVVVLTKPLGTQIAVNVNQWRRSVSSDGKPNDFWKKCVDGGVITEDQATQMMHAAVCSMARLNRNGARLMLKYKATAATDVTGFGILGHAQNLSENQVAEVSIHLSKLPCIDGTTDVNDKVFNFRLTVGYSAETSGGLLVCLPSQQAAEDFCTEIQQIDGEKAWIIGNVVADPSRKSIITNDVEIVSV